MRSESLSTGLWREWAAAKGSTLYKYFIKGNENTDFVGHDFNDAENRIMCQSQRDVHWTQGWCRQEGEERPRSVRLGTLCQKWDYVNKLGLYLALMWSSGLRTRLRSCIRDVRQGQFPPAPDDDQVPQLGPCKGLSSLPDVTQVVSKLLFDLCVWVTSGYTSG